MTINRTAIQAGKKFERDLLTYLREDGFDVERLRLTGTEDEGDLLLRTFAAERVVIEAKAEKGFNIAGWIKEAQVEAVNYARHRAPNGDIWHPASTMPYPVVVHKARGKGVGEAYVTMTLDDFLALLKEAGEPSA